MSRTADDLVMRKLVNFGERINDKRIGENLEKPKSLTEKGGFVELLIEADDPRFSSVGLIDITMTGYGLIFTSQGSDSGVALQVSFNNAGTESVTNFKAGASFKGFFERVVLSLDPTSLSVGTARLIILTAPDVDYIEFPNNGSVTASTPTTPMGPSGAATQAAGVASRGANAPVPSTDGVSLEGVASFVVTVECTNAAATITGGNIRLWRLNPVTNRWSRGPIIELLDTGGRSAVSSEYETKVPAGRFYVELCDFTTSLASTATVNVTTGGIV